MNIELRCPEDLDVLKQLQRRERNAKQRDRYRAVLLALNGQTAPAIAAKLDRSRSPANAAAHVRQPDPGV